mgnify:CR=1 FL=1
MPTYESTGSLTTATKSFSTARKPRLEGLQYTLNGQSITIDVVGSPGTSSEEVVTQSLDGASEYALSWGSSHTDFQLEISISTSDDTATPTVDDADLGPDPVRAGGRSLAATSPGAGTTSSAGSNAGTTGSSATGVGAGFGGIATFTGGDPDGVSTTVGAAASIAAVQAATTSAATAVGPAASVVEPRVHIRAETSVQGAGVALTQVGGSEQTASTIAPSTPTVSATGGSLSTTATPSIESFATAIPGGHVTAETTVSGGSIPAWLIHPADGSGPLLARPDSVSLDASTLSLSVTVLRNQIGRWRQFDRAGDLSIEQGFGGRFEAVDQGGRVRAPTIEPPADRSPPFRTGEWYVNAYDEEQVAVDRYQVSLTLQRLEPRLDERTPPSETGTWTLDLATGSLGLAPEQVGQVSQSGTTAGGEWTLPLSLSDAEAAAIVDVCGVPDAVVSREVPGGEDVVDDTSPSGRQTVTLSPPAAASIPGGDYAVEDWQLAWDSYGRRPWSVELTLASLS